MIYNIEIEYLTSLFSMEVFCITDMIQVEYLTSLSPMEVFCVTYTIEVEYLTLFFRIEMFWHYGLDSQIPAF